MPSGRLTILIAEDEAPLRRLLVKALESVATCILEASDGAEALVVARDYPGRIDLLISDVVMPRLTGPELASQIATTHAESQVLLISGYAQHLQHISTNCDWQFLYKPFTPTQLRERVVSMTQQKLAAAG